MDHWQLLSSIICCSDIEGSRRVKAWLTPLLNRTPLAPILIAFLDQIPRLSPEIQTTVFTSFTPCFSVLWPLAKHKINVETLLECFSATLKIVCLDVNQNLAQPHVAVCSTVANSYFSALTRASNRKKVGPQMSLVNHSSMIQYHLALFYLPVEPFRALASLYSRPSPLWTERSLLRWSRNSVFPGNSSPANR